MISKILVGIDGSKTAEKALYFALDLAGKYSAEIELITVLDVISDSLIASGMVFSPNATTKYLEELKNGYEKIQ